jgi:SAM-dependent methyltransferase
MYEQRRDFLKNLIGNNELLGIEIGGLDKPLIVRTELLEGSEILYADHLSTADLKTKYKADPTVNLNAIVEVDLVSESGDFANSLNGRLVDYVVASHVVEHIPNPIRWLQSLFDVLRPGGFVFLVVPDKRFTFDFQRPTTTFGEMLESFLSNKKMPSVKDVFDHHSSAVMIDASRVWKGVLGKEELVPLASNKNAFKYAQEVHEDGVYYDVHISIFTPLSFFMIVESLIETKLLMPEIIDFQDTSANDIEFFVGLKKPLYINKNIKELCIASLPSLPLDSLISPYMPQVASLSASLAKLTDIHQDFQNSFARVETELHGSKSEVKLIEKRLDLAQKVLDRRSIRFVMMLIHNIFKIVQLFKRKRF